MSADLPPLYPPANVFEWKVKVTAVSKADTVFVRFCEYEQKYKEMVDRMKIFYLMNPRKVSRAVKDGLYVAISTTKAARVRVVDQNKDSINCYFIDNGFSRQLKIRALHEIQDTFKELPAQAYEFELHSIDDTDDVKSYVSQIVNERMGKEFVAKLIHRKQLGKCVVELYFDVKNELLDENCLNIAVNRFIRRQNIEQLLSKKGSLVDVYVTHCVIKHGNCVISVQMDDDNLKQLNANQENIDNSCERFGQKLDNTSAPFNSIYYVKSNEHWRRVKISNIDDGMAYVFFIDYGYSEFVELSEIRELDELMDLNRFIPFLVHEVSLVPTKMMFSETDAVFLLNFFGVSVATMYIDEVADENHIYPLVNIFKSITAEFEKNWALKATTSNLADKAQKTHFKDLNNIFSKRAVVN
ncbi:tudor domain-containing protein 7-like isoform X2 [Leptotrombidium deliense]|uniref:Tudor domain-containing protein 7-like isoform X2 n=1 Tax=Leptotrombidium deliense TaxID=299467 RepID=A0A443S5Q0_9ACAR|nr:tudor domain-containing protein 7-like isoform X2 [Leptotrombidium deliense]